MPVQYLYPTGIAYSFNTWVNQSGHLYTNSNIGTKDIDEGVPGSNSDWLKNLGAFESTTYALDLYCGPLLVEPEVVDFRMVYYYSGDSTGMDRIRMSTALYDGSNNSIAEKVKYNTIGSVNTDFTTITYSGDIVSNNVNASNTRLQLAIAGISPYLAEDIEVFSSGHIISAIEIFVSGDSISNSGLNLYLAGYHQKNICLKPEAFDGLSNRWLTNYNYSGIFDLAYLRLEEGSGNVVRSDNSSISGVYTLTTQGLQSGLLWHNKRLSFNQSPTYEHAPKFNSVNDSAILFNSGILYNKNNFSILSRFFPSGSTFVSNGIGYTDLVTYAPQDTTSDWSWKIHTSGFQEFSVLMYDSGHANVNGAGFFLDGTAGIDLLFTYNSGIIALYGQSHLGMISSGIGSINSIEQNHRYKLGIGGLLSSGVA